MRALTKGQTEALVEEIQERIQDTFKSVPLPGRVAKAWEKLQEDFNILHKAEDEADELYRQYEEARDRFSAIEEKMKKKVRDFEYKHDVNVSWRSIDRREGEVPTISIPVHEMKDKISRQLAILSIDKKLQDLSTDEVIEILVTRFTS